MPEGDDKIPNLPLHFTWRLFRRTGVWYADGRGNRPNLGKHSLGTRDRAEALVNLRRLDHAKAVERGKIEPVAPPPASPVGIADGWRLFDDHVGRPEGLGGAGPGTRKRYRPVRDKHVAYCRTHGIETWNEFDKDRFHAYAIWLASRVADATFYLECTVLKQVINLLVEAGRLPASAKFKFQLVKPAESDRYCFTAAEVRAMLGHCDRTPDLTWLGLVILALAHTGLRIGELAAVRWSDVDDGLRTIWVADERSSRRKKQAGTARRVKGKRSRAVPVHPRLREALSRLDRSHGGPVFRAPRGGALRPRNVLEQFLKHVIRPLKGRFPTPPGEVGFEHGVIHSFRHYFVSQAFLSGASEAEIRSWTGHRGSRIVERYRHLAVSDSVRKMESLDLLGGSAPDNDAIETRGVRQGVA